MSSHVFCTAHHCGDRCGFYRQFFTPTLTYAYHACYFFFLHCSHLHLILFFSMRQWLPCPATHTHTARVGPHTFCALCVLYTLCCALHTFCCVPVPLLHLPLPALMHARLITAVPACLQLTHTQTPQHGVTTMVVSSHLLFPLHTPSFSVHCVPQHVSLSAHLPLSLSFLALSTAYSLYIV